MKTFEEISRTEMEQVEGGIGLLGLVVVVGVGAAAVAGAYALGQSMGSKDCPFTPKK
jgi:lactobin A/cerein 7B family class IIb bacteriocin